MRKLHLDDSNKITTICSRCLFERIIELDKIEKRQRKIKVICRCGEDHEYIIEYRKNYRKDVKLPGQYIIQGKGKKGDIIIKNLSMSGIQFECLNLHQILKDDTLEVEFNLDNSKRSEIKKSVKVIWVKDRTIGAAYIETESYRTDLGFYLQF